MDSSQKTTGASHASDELETADVTAAVPTSQRRRSKGHDERSRLVVELSPETSTKLNDLCDLEDSNKTKVVNRAIWLYHYLRTAEAAGGQVLVSKSEGQEPREIVFMS